MNDLNSLPLAPTPLCARYRSQLALLRTGALSPREAAVVNEHAASCPWCERELAAYDALDVAARQYLASAAFTPLTMEEIQHAAAPQTLSRSRPAASVAATVGRSRTSRATLRRWPRLSALAPLAAVVLLVLFAGLIFATQRAGLGDTRGGKPTLTAPASGASLTHITWTLTRLVVDGHEKPLVPGHAPTLYFGRREGQFDGESGCNSYGGTYTLAGDTLHFSGLFSTLVACAAPGVSAQEDAYMAALPRVERYSLDGNSLMLTSADGSVQMTFRSTPAVNTTPSVAVSPSASITPTVNGSGYVPTPTTTPVANGFCATVLPEPTLESAIGQPFGAPQENNISLHNTPVGPEGEVQCVYPGTGSGSAYAVSVDVQYRAGLNDAKEAFNNWKQANSYPEPTNVTPVAGVGDDAFWVRDSQQIYFRKGRVIGYLQVQGP